MKKTWKQMMAAGLCLVMVLGTWGCGAKTGEAKETEKSVTAADQKQVHLTLGYWGGNQTATMQALADAYCKENPDISIEIQMTPYRSNEYWTKLEAGAMGGTAPDVFWINNLHVGSYQEGGILADLTDAASELDMKSHFPNMLVDMYTIDEKIYAIPKDLGVRAMWYNKELFDKAGIDYPTDDWTWADFKKAAADMKGKLGEGTYPMAAAVDFEAEYYPTVYAAGGYVLNEDKTKSGYDNPKTIEGIQCWIDCIEEGLSPTIADLTDTNADTRFQAGQLAMHFAGSYLTNQYDTNEVIRDKIDLVEFPEFNGKEPNLVNGLGYAVYEGSKNKKEAIAFAVWLGGEEAMRIQGEMGVVISARNDAQKYYAQTFPDWNINAFFNHLDEAPMLPFCNDSAEIYDLEARKYMEAYTGIKTLDQVSKELQEEVDAILARSR